MYIEMKLLLFQIFLLFIFSSNSKIRNISLIEASYNFEILLNQSYSELYSFDCLYDIFNNKSVKITIEHLNSYFYPSNKIYNDLDYIITYENISLDYFLSFKFEFNQELFIKKELYFQMFLSELKCIQRKDNTYTYNYILSNSNLGFQNLHQYSLIKEIFNHCGNQIEKLLNNSFNIILNQLFKVYPISDNEFIFNKISNYFTGMTDYCYMDFQNKTLYKGRINKVSYLQYKRINSEKGIFENVTFQLYLKYNQYKKNYKVLINELHMNSTGFLFKTVNVKENDEIIKLFLDDIFNNVFKTVMNGL